ncbi:MAG TPA: RNA methyltransferase [Trichocoleus sp.]
MAEARLAHVRIVLVEPAGPLNVGSVARVMKNMGLRQLVLVNPQCDPLSDEARQMAVHGADVLEAATRVETLLEALSGCQRAIATTARLRATGEPLEMPEAVLPWLLPEPVESGIQTALIFGPEDRGLNNKELSYAQRYLRIPSSDDYPSLNLAQAVAVCCYCLRRIVLTASASAENAWSSSARLGAVPGVVSNAVRAQTDSPNMDLPNTVPAADPAEPAALLDQIDGFHQQLEDLLLRIGYLYPHTASSRMEKFRRLLYRAAPSQQELAMLRGILSQVDWALTSNQSSEQQ